ncbi:MAG: hypothetical protein IJ039_00615 [Clostridia bacterium]|nr:hypothetical protein [Clostridia bacterium]
MEQDKNYSEYIEKKKLYIFLYLLTALTIILFLVVWFNLNSKIEKINDSVEIYTPTYNEINNTKEEKKTYLLKEYNGKLAVYINNDFQYEIDVYVFTLPEEDRKLLSKGIEAASEQELNEIISSYY